MFPILHPALGLPEGTPKAIAQVAGGLPVILGGAAIAAPALSPFLQSVAAAKLIPMGTVAATTVKKTIIGGGAVTLIAGGAGLLAGTLLGGGGSQEQKQAAAQDLRTQQEQKLAANLKATLRDFQAKAALVAKGKAEITTTVTPTITPTYKVTAGGDVDIGGVTETIITTDISSVTQGLTSAQVGQILESRQEAAQVSIQMPAITQTQEAQQEGGGTNWAILAAIGLVAAYFIFGRKKRAG